MENTGRISRSINPSARRILFGDTANGSIVAEMKYITQVDRAHLVMLSECGLIESSRAAKLLCAIRELEASGFAPLAAKSAVRGLYLLYEDYLIEQLGAETGGILHTARSRNDLNATVLLLRLRSPYLKLLRESSRLLAVLLGRARYFARTVMPAYTHYQAAVPITYGHYLAGIASALARDINSVLAIGVDLGRCPLGAGAVGGTSFPIHTDRTAKLLGFEAPVKHSIDAVASRDFILRLLSAATILGVTLSRLATDLLTWTTAEFGFLELPDQLVGSSSMMPQKRNPFLLEHVQGRSSSALGAFVNAATAMHAKPFTNSISVGTEAVSHVWPALQNITEATVLARLVVSGAKPIPEAMLERAERGYICATEFANRLVTCQGMPFRNAHHTVGSLISQAIENRDSLTQMIAQWRGAEECPSAFADLDAASVARSSGHGGGPGDASLQSCLQTLQAEWARLTRARREQEERWTTAATALSAAVSDLTSKETVNS